MSVNVIYKEVIDFMAQHYVLDCVLMYVFTKLIEISPIKIYPLTILKKLIDKMLRGIGTKINADTNERFDKIDKSMKDIEEQLRKVENVSDQRRIKDIRWEIFEFAELVRKEHQDIQSYNHVYEIHDEYEELLAKYNMTNGKINRAMDTINRHYNADCDN